ncbi:alpha/beta fold hydrolase [Streptomyces albireticuli]|uniref:Transporter n=1 Tax=Streptomyces albireticuli TaxID=1940 RepID=A0A2A2DAM5_9ACTN|nr:alpha/beta fold hydrolase [Streptomyces albireticuli]MCD9195230.1 alpha/beta hydrolase [Streptomyces albireticuli]PAU48362.1 transporter [Streptomyces albireticuli]
MTKHGINAAAVTVALVLTTFGPIPSGAAAHSDAAGHGRAAPSRFVPGPCPKTPEPIAALSTARCGFLEVPENRARPGGRTIRLAAAVIPATSAKPAADPVVFMSGGPGGETFDDIPFLVDSGLNRDRALIVMAQRGNLYDRPNLACPEMDRFHARYVGLGYGSPRAKRLLLDSVKKCRDRLAADGIDLSAYNTAENAADFAALRTALGISRWNVYGHSYGTNVALTYLREHPQGIRAVALDSSTAPQSVTLPWGWRSAREGIGNILKACAAEPRCDSRYPDLRRTLAAQVRRLEAHPLTLNARPPRGGEPVKVVLDGGALLNLLVANAVPLPDVPAAIEELAHGRPERFARARAADSAAVVGMTAHGLTESVACAEWVPGYTRSDVLKAGRRAFPGWPDTVLAQAPQLPFQHEVCRVWDVPDRAASQRVATSSSVPALLIAGTFDAKVGASWSREAARTLSRSTFVRIPGIGHWVVPQSPCAQQVLASFLARPTAPDTRCVAGLTPQPFTIIPK